MEWKSNLSLLTHDATNYELLRTWALTEVMKPYLPSKPQCLQLFAWYMFPYWKSVGDQLPKTKSCLFTQIDHHLNLR